MKNNIWHKVPKCLKTGDLLKEKKRKTDCSKGCVQCPSCGRKCLQELLTVLNFIVTVPNFIVTVPKLQAQDTLCLDPTGG